MSVTRKRIINVTQEDIDGATRGSSSHCMIAEAMKRGGGKSVAVDIQTLRETDPAAKKRSVWLTPPVAQLALIAFDEGERMEPFSFTLSRPIQIRRSGKGASNATKVKSGGGGNARPTIEGGPTIPTANLASGNTGRPPDKKNPTLRSGRGMRRQYGLRQLKP